MSLISREMAVDDIAAGRDGINRVDVAIGMLLDRRAELVAGVQHRKAAEALPVRDQRREREVVRRVAAAAPHLDHESVARVMSAVMDGCIASAWTVPSDGPGAAEKLTA